MTDIELLEEALLLDAPEGLLVRDLDHGLLKVVELYVTPEGEDGAKPVLHIITEEER